MPAGNSNLEVVLHDPRNQKIIKMLHKRWPYANEQERLCYSKWF